MKLARDQEPFLESELFCRFDEIPAPSSVTVDPMMEEDIF
jgi:hypothetical protein